nr:hypothetical protein [Tanacetum cinerariifolium]
MRSGEACCFSQPRQPIGQRCWTYTKKDFEGPPSENVPIVLPKEEDPKRLIGMSIIERNPHQEHGVVQDKTGKTAATLIGKWDESMGRCEVNDGRGSLEGGETAKTQLSVGKMRKLWLFVVSRQGRGMKNTCTIPVVPGTDKGTHTENYLQEVVCSLNTHVKTIADELQWDTRLVDHEEGPLRHLKDFFYRNVISQNFTASGCETFMEVVKAIDLS